MRLHTPPYNCTCIMTSPKKIEQSVVHSYTSRLSPCPFSSQCPDIHTAYQNLIFRKNATRVTMKPSTKNGIFFFEWTYNSIIRIIVRKNADCSAMKPVTQREKNNWSGCINFNSSIDMKNAAYLCACETLDLLEILLERRGHQSIHREKDNCANETQTFPEK